MYRIWQEAKCKGYRDAYPNQYYFVKHEGQVITLHPCCIWIQSLLKEAIKFETVYSYPPLLYFHHHIVSVRLSAWQKTLSTQVYVVPTRSTLSNTQKMMHSSHHYIEIPWEYIICIHNNTFVGNEQASHVENPNYRIRSNQRLLLYWIHRYWMYFSE